MILKKTVLLITACSVVLSSCSTVSIPSSSTKSTQQQKNSRPILSNTDRLYSAILSDNIQEAEKLINNGANVNATHGTCNNTALHFASSDDMVKLLLKYKANPNIKNCTGKTAREYNWRVNNILKEQEESDAIATAAGAALAVAAIYGIGKWLFGGGSSSSNSSSSSNYSPVYIEANCGTYCYPKLRITPPSGVYIADSEQNRKSVIISRSEFKAGNYGYEVDFYHGQSGLFAPDKYIGSCSGSVYINSGVNRVDISFSTDNTTFSPTHYSCNAHVSQY